MNPKYYVTPEEAKKVIDFLNIHGIGGGVVEVNPTVFTGPFQVPKVEGKEMLGLVLANGCEMNAGLTLDLMSKGYGEWMLLSLLRTMARPEPGR